MEDRRNSLRERKYSLPECYAIRFCCSWEILRNFLFIVEVWSSRGMRHVKLPIIKGGLYGRSASSALLIAESSTPHQMQNVQLVVSI